jgi:signal transduction histidine kinase
LPSVISLLLYIVLSSLSFLPPYSDLHPSPFFLFLSPTVSTFLPFWSCYLSSSSSFLFQNSFPSSSLPSFSAGLVSSSIRFPLFLCYYIIPHLFPAFLSPSSSCLLFRFFSTLFKLNIFQQPSSRYHVNF